MPAIFTDEPQFVRKKTLGFAQEQTDVVEEMEKQRQLGEIHRILHRQLTQRERDIIRMRYGLLDGRELTQKDVGEKLGISRSYVSRIEKRALEKLKNAYCTEMQP